MNTQVELLNQIKDEINRRIDKLEERITNVSCYPEEQAYFNGIERASQLAIDIIDDHIMDLENE